MFFSPGFAEWSECTHPCDVRCIAFEVVSLKFRKFEASLAWANLFINPVDSQLWKGTKSRLMVQSLSSVKGNLHTDRLESFCFIQSIPDWCSHSSRWFLELLALCCLFITPNMLAPVPCFSTTNIPISSNLKAWRKSCCEKWVNVWVSTSFGIATMFSGLSWHI